MLFGAVLENVSLVVNAQNRFAFTISGGSVPSWVHVCCKKGFAQLCDHLATQSQVLRAAHSKLTLL